jgi:RNA binding exosome subunit
MKLAHQVKLSAFVYPEESEEPIKKKLFELATVLPDADLENEKMRFTRTAASGFQERKIIILELTLQKEKTINQFFRALTQHLSQTDKNMILNQKNRIDDQLSFFLRLDKPALLSDAYEVVDHGDCFHIKCSIAAYPHTKEAAYAVIGNIFK